jgi:hypothetical protein
MAGVSLRLRLERLFSRAEGSWEQFVIDVRNSRGIYEVNAEPCYKGRCIRFKAISRGLPIIYDEPIKSMGGEILWADNDSARDYAKNRIMCIVVNHSYALDKERREIPVVMFIKQRRSFTEYPEVDEIVYSEAEIRAARESRRINVPELIIDAIPDGISTRRFTPFLPEMALASAKPLLT